MLLLFLAMTSLRMPLVLCAMDALSRSARCEVAGYHKLLCLIFAHISVDSRSLCWLGCPPTKPGFRYLSKEKNHFTNNNSAVLQKCSYQ